MEQFTEWFKENLSEQARDIAEHGADADWPCITYTADCCDLFDQFADEIWDHAVQEAEDFGCKNVAEMIAGFGRSDMLETWDTFRNLMLWYACETVARQITDEQEAA